MQNIAEICPATCSGGSALRQLVMSQVSPDLRSAENNHSKRRSGPRGSRPEYERLAHGRPRVPAVERESGFEGDLLDPPKAGLPGLWGVITHRIFSVGGY